MRQVHFSKDWVVMTVAVGLSTALNLITAAVLFYAFYNPSHQISDNAVQLLTGWGGGMIGIVGAYVGYRASRDQAALDNDGNGDGGGETPDLVDASRADHQPNPNPNQAQPAEPATGEEPAP